MEGLEGRIRKSNSIAFSRPGFCGTGRRMQRGAQVRRCRCAKRVPLPMQSFPPLGISATPERVFLLFLERAFNGGTRRADQKKQ